MNGRILIVLALAGALGGCFVVDELDSGQASMDRNSPRGKARAESAAAEGRSGARAARSARSAHSARSGEDSGSVVDTGREALASVEGWWDELGEPEPLPDDEIVQCRLGGSVQFTLESTCRARGGVPKGG
ncbi:MAG: hypothetical protein ACQGVK_19105 [Myxococcota bacterium]